MQKMTSAYANKKLKSLEEDKAFWVNKEATSCTYIAAINEEPVDVYKRQQLLMMLCVRLKRKIKD